MRKRLLVPLIAAGIACAGAGAALAAPTDVDQTVTVVSAGFSPAPRDAVLRLVVDEPWRGPVGDGMLALGAGTVGAAAAAQVLTRRRRHGP